MSIYKTKRALRLERLFYVLWIASGLYAPRNDTLAERSH